MHLVSASQLKKLLGITDAKYINYVSRKLLITDPSLVKGRGSVTKYRRVDVLKNFIFIELIKCHVTHTKAHIIATNALTNGDTCILQLTDYSQFVIDLSEIKQKILLSEG